jgi:hypothetical protein
VRPSDGAFLLVLGSVAAIEIAVLFIWLFGS